MKLPPMIYFEKIIDTGDPECSLVGPGWFASANPGFWGSTPAQLNPVGNGSSYAEFRPRIFTEAIYEVYGWWVSSSNRCQDTPFIIKHKNGTDTVRVNQVQNGSMWKLIGSYTFSNDTSQKIIISNAGTPGTSATYVVADAIKLISYNPATSFNENEITQVSDFKLNQNYPNPVSATDGNPGTTISWQSAIGSLPDGKAGWQTIKLYNALGEEIDTIVEGYFEAGKHSTFYILNSTLPSGVYFYRLQAGNFVETKKMILMR
jgi:hypothetical protein